MHLQLVRVTTLATASVSMEAAWALNVGNGTDIVEPPIDNTETANSMDAEVCLVAD